MIKAEITADAADVPKKSSVIWAAAWGFLVAIGPAIIEAWNMIPDDWKQYLPEGPARWVITAVFAVLIVLRYLHITVKPKEGAP